MTQPVAYYPNYNFTAFQQAHPSTPLPASNVDAELFAISASITEICINLGMIQRADGALANDSVGLAQLQTSLMVGVNAATNWVTNFPYIEQAAVYENNAIYVCLVSHTSGVFANDLAAGYWQLVLDFSTYIGACSASAAAAAASATAAAASAANMTATSTTSQTPGTGAMTFTTQSGKFFNPGSYVEITSNANPTVNNINAQITSYSGTSLVVNAVAFNGTGAHTDWTINLSGGPGATGPQGPAGTGAGDMLRSNNLSDVLSASTSRTNLGLGSAALQANSFFAQTANNLSDLASAATARSNLGAAASGYNNDITALTNINAITSPSSATPLYLQNDNAIICTNRANTARLPVACGPGNANGLAVIYDQFVNAPYSTAGYLKFPGGIIIQWGSYNSSAGGDVNVLFSQTFPNGALAFSQTVISSGASSAWAAANSLTSTGFHGAVFNQAGTRATYAVSYIAIGH